VARELLNSLQLHLDLHLHSGEGILPNIHGSALAASTLPLGVSRSQPWRPLRGFQGLFSKRGLQFRLQPGVSPEPAQSARMEAWEMRINDADTTPFSCHSDCRTTKGGADAGTPDLKRPPSSDEFAFKQTRAIARRWGGNKGSGFLLKGTCSTVKT